MLYKMYKYLQNSQLSAHPCLVTKIVLLVKQPREVIYSM